MLKDLLSQFGMGNRLHSLDGLRGVSALIVLLFHIGRCVAPNGIFAHGYLAVDVFFLMSGFVIANAYENRLLEGFGVFAFIRARVRRLAPVYWAGTLLGMACVAPTLIWRDGVFDGDTATLLVVVILFAFLLVPIGRLVLAFPFNGPAWSLFAELVVNVFYAICVRRLGIRALLAIVFVGFAISATFGASNNLGWNFGWRTSELVFAVYRASPSFAMGVVLYRLWKTGKLNVLPSVSPVVLIFAWLSLLAFPSRSHSFVWDTLIIILVAPLLVALLVRTDRPSPRWFTVAGALSYPLYVSHYSLVQFAYKTSLASAELKTSLLYAAAVFAVALAIAAAIHRWVENPDVPIRIRSVGEQMIG